jgi:hypothetical protein
MQESNGGNRVHDSFPKTEGSEVTNQAKANHKQITLYSATLIVKNKIIKFIIYPFLIFTATVDEANLSLLISFGVITTPRFSRTPTDTHNIK